MMELTNGVDHGNGIQDGDGQDEDPRIAVFREHYARSEAKIAALFAGNGAGDWETLGAGEKGAQADGHGNEEDPAAHKKPVRKIDEDNYDDSEEEEDDAPAAKVVKPTASPIKPALSPMKPISDAKTVAPTDAKSSEEARKKLEEDKKAAEDAAKRSFTKLFYTLENDRDAMLEQQKLEEADRQVDAEMSGGANNTSNANNTAATNGQGKLSNVNLGASSLTLKHLIARIDAKRDMVRVSDMELRNLMSEVRKNRSKWASEDKVGQEELYEAAEKVLSELKAHTEHSTAFLNRVNKREAPDYYNSKYP
jgi:transcriptional activator SPT7